MAFLHPRTTLYTFYKHSQSRGIGDLYWDAATGITTLDPGLSIDLPQTLKLSAAHRSIVLVSVLVYYNIWRTCGVLPANSAVWLGLLWGWHSELWHTTNRGHREFTSLCHTLASHKPQKSSAWQDKRSVWIDKWPHIFDVLSWELYKSYNFFFWVNYSFKLYNYQ